MRKTAKVHTAFAIFTALALNIPPVRASQDYLPDKAKTVAEKWSAFEKTAQPADRESKRKEVIRYLSGLLKAEASKANLDGALAVKALMEKLEAPKPVIQAIIDTDTTFTDPYPGNNGAVSVTIKRTKTVAAPR